VPVSRSRGCVEACQGAPDRGPWPLLSVSRRGSSSAMVVREAAAILSRVCAASAADSSQQQQQQQQQRGGGLFRRAPSVGRKSGPSITGSPQPAAAGSSILSSTRSSGNGSGILEGPQMLPLPSSPGGPSLPISSSAVDDSELGVSRNVHDAGLLVLPSLSREGQGWLRTPAAPTSATAAACCTAVRGSGAAASNCPQGKAQPGPRCGRSQLRPTLPHKHTRPLSPAHPSHATQGATAATSAPGRPWRASLRPPSSRWRAWWARGPGGRTSCRWGAHRARCCVLDARTAWHCH
jgi:hypothetical protein